jgi:hypothetical protein
MGARTDRSASVAIVMLVSLLLPALVAAEECLELIGELPGGRADSVELVGHTAYVGVGGWFQIVDITEPDAPTIESSLRIPAAFDIEIAGNLAFVSNVSGLTIIDIQDPQAPLVVGSLEHPHGGHSVSLVGDLAVVMSYTSLWIADVSNPEAPVQIGYLDLVFDSLYDLAVVGNQAFVSAYNDGLSLIDISDPSSPVLVSIILPTDKVLGLTSTGDLVFVAVWDHGLRILDASTPFAPLEIGWIDTLGHAQRVEVSGNLALIGETDDGLRIIDIIDPTSPFELGLIDPQYQITNLAADGGIALVTAGGELRIIDIHEPSTPFEINKMLQRGRARHLVVSDQIAYAIPTGRYSDQSGLGLVDVSNPADPIPLGFSQIESPHGVVVSGHYAFVLAHDSSYEIIVFDVSSPTDPVRLVSYAIPGWCDNPRKLDFVGSHLVIGCYYESGLRFFDITPPSEIHEVGSIGFDRSLLDFAVADDLVLASLTQGEVRMVDASIPSAPQIIGTYHNPSSSVASVEISGSLAYLMTNVVPTALHTIDISTPEQPTLVDVSPAPSGTLIEVEGGYALMRYLKEFFVLDVTLPSHVVEVARYRFSDDILGMQTEGNHVFSSADDTYLEVLFNCWIFADSFESGSTTAWSAVAEGCHP